MLKPMHDNYNRDGTQASVKMLSRRSRSTRSAGGDYLLEGWQLAATELPPERARASFALCLSPDGR
jgi:hypothetical protein